MGKINIFLSYCWNDEGVADDICDFFKEVDEIHIHRDKIDVKAWRDIKEFMNSISEMDYIIILVSEKYLKSDNCMYEVLEVMRDRKYKDKIFPAIIEHSIYKAVNRLDYIKYWVKQYEDFKKEIESIDIENLSSSVETLKLYQNIAANVDGFLANIAYMNNHEISSVPEKIMMRLKDEGIFINDNKKNISTRNILEFVGISNSMQQKNHQI